MPSFEDIMKKPASEIQPPKPLPPGTYHCIVEGQPERQESSQKKVPCWVYKFKIIGIGDDVDQRSAAEAGAIGKVLSGQAIGTAFYINPNSENTGEYRYKEFMEHHLGISSEGKDLDQMQMEVPGKQLLVKLAITPAQDGSGRIFNKIESTMHV